MGMQCHFKVSDIPSACKVIKGSSEEDSEEGLEQFYHIYIPALLVWVDTDAAHERAWFDVGSYSQVAQVLLKWLIKNRIPFNCS